MTTTIDTPARTQDQDAITRHTQRSITAGNRVLQIYQCGSEREHCARLLDWMNPPQDAIIADVGCGVGEVAARMQEIRPDLEFFFVNSNESQLRYCPPGRSCLADMHKTGFIDHFFDVVMVNYALGYAHLPAFLNEAHRILKPGGILFIYDMASRNGACPVMDQCLNYTVHSIDTVERAARLSGFQLDSASLIDGATREHMVKLLDPVTSILLERVDKEVVPAKWRFVNP